jgi:ATP-dependent DNA helicase PIF1
VHPSNELQAALHADAASRRAMLAVHNDRVAQHNLAVLDQLPGPVIHAYGREVVVSDKNTVAEPDIVSDEFLERVHDVNAPDHRIMLKAGCLITLLRNLQPDAGILNGTRLRVTNVTSKFVVASTLTAVPQRVFLPRIKFPIRIPGSELHICRYQFPIRLAYSVTVNKSQGKTLDRVCYDDRSGAFSHGQPYVAPGRVRSIQDVAFLVDPARVVVDGNTVRVIVTNVVYPELLLREGSSDRLAAARAPAHTGRSVAAVVAALRGEGIIPAADEAIVGGDWTADGAPVDPDSDAALG